MAQVLVGRLRIDKKHSSIRELREAHNFPVDDDANIRLVYEWALLERVMRDIVRSRRGDNFAGTPVSALIEAYGDEVELPREDRDNIRSLLNTRNNVVHGRNFGERRRIGVALAAVEKYLRGAVRIATLADHETDVSGDRIIRTGAPGDKRLPRKSSDGLLFDKRTGRRAMTTARATLLAGFIAASATLAAGVLGSVTMLVTDDDPTQVPASTLYMTYVSTNSDDARLGLPVVLRQGSAPPAPQYKPKEVLGYGFPPDSSQPAGTHLIYDFFCTGSGNTKPCGGVLRSHYYTTNRKAESPWQDPPDSIMPIAQFYDVRPDGSCAPEQQPVYRFERISPSGAKLFDVGATNPGVGWTTAENLGCVIQLRR